MKNNVATSLPVQLTHAVIVTDALGIKAASVEERDQAMTGLFMGLTRAVQKGAHVGRCHAS